MKLLIIGTSVEDFVHSSGSVYRRPGGVFYSASAVNYIKEDSDEIFLLTGIDKKNYDLFAQLYEGFNKEFILSVDKIPAIHLYVDGMDERCERYENLQQKLDLNIAGNLNSFDGILINMITGFDISLEDLKLLRSRFGGLIFLDVHTLARGLNANMERKFRPIPDAGEWLRNADIIQVNEKERGTVSQIEDDFEAAREILSYGPTYLIETRAAKGARIYYLDREDLSMIQKPAFRIELKNKIGCGDVFGSVFFYSFLKSGDIATSLDLANAAGASAAEFVDLNQFKNLKNAVFTKFN